jgi:hypothetical protein
MPHLARLKSALVRLLSAPTGWIAPWHVLCSCGLSGCFYFGPLPQLEENEPPVILRTSHIADTPITWKDTSVNVWVQASDPEGNGLSFFFELNNLPLGTATQISTDPEGWMVVLPYDPSLNGQILTCTVYDHENIPAWTSISWPLEVL